ncbi:hypothetical protein CerSpe_196860 [Prunus speciosa]
MATEGGRRKPELCPCFLEEAYERCRKICAEFAKTYYISRSPSNLLIIKSCQDIFEGRPHDMRDAVLTHTVSNFSLDIKPVRDFIKGEWTQENFGTYQNFQELYLYCYYGAGTVGSLSVTVMGIAPDSVFSAQGVYEAAFYLGIANQLTNILRDVGEE